MNLVGDNLRPHQINLIPNSFIRGYYIDSTVCSQLINYFENLPDKHKQIGTIGGTNDNNEYQPKLDPTRKDSLDTAFSPESEYFLFQNYLRKLSIVLELYKKEFYFCENNVARWKIIENINLQRYLPNQGFHQFHHENSNLGTIKRHLVFMTYLNTINDGGETEWFYQKLQIKPEIGLTVIWPSDWTHTHRGIVSTTETKYIATGWYSKY